MKVDNSALTGEVNNIIKIRYQQKLKKLLID